MAEDIIIRYRADIKDLEKKLELIAKGQKGITKQTKETTQAIQKGASVRSKSADDTIRDLKKQEASLKQLKKVRDLISKSAIAGRNAAQLKKLNKEIDKTEANIRSLQKTTKTSLKKTEKSFKSLEKNAKKSLNKTGNSFTKFAAGAAAALAAAFSVQVIIDFGRRSIEEFAKFESLTVAFSTLVGSARLAKELLQELDDFSVKTPFTPEQVQEAARALKSFGFATEDLLPTIKTLGDVSAGTGKDLKELAIIFGQIKSTGRLLGQDLLQLINAGFNPLQEISEKTGQSVSFLRDEMSRGRIPFELVAKAFKDATTEGGKFNELTQKLALTTQGQLSTIEGQVTQIQREIGEVLAPAFVKAHLIAVTLLRDIVNFSSVIGGALSGGFAGFTAALAKLEAKRNATAKTLADGVRKQTELESIQFVAELNHINIINAAQIKIEEILESQKRNKSEIVELEKKDTAANRARLRVITASNKESNERLRIIGLIVEDEVNRIKKEKSATKELKKGSDKRIAGTEKEVRLLRSLSSEYEHLLALTNSSEFKELLDLTINADLESIEAINQRVQSLVELIDENDLDIAITVPDNPFETITEQFNRLKSAIEDEGIKVNIGIDDIQLKNLRSVIAELSSDDAQNKIVIEFEAELNEKNAARLKEDAKRIGSDMGDNLSDGFEDKIERTVDASINLLFTLGNLYSTFYDRQIEDIERQKEAELSAIDSSLKANEDALKNRRVSEREAANIEKELLDQKIKAEEKAAKKTREIKRKQAILDKAAALIDIAINTQRAASATLAAVPLPAGAALLALTIALGAAQAAIVAAQPIPYEKGSKDTGSKGHMARVGERGEEFVYMPSHSKVVNHKGTKRHGDVIDAIQDNRLDKFILDRYVNPALVRQQKESKAHQSESFAKNIGSSINYNTKNTGLNLYDLERNRKRGTSITNANEIGKAVADAMERDIYR